MDAVAENDAVLAALLFSGENIFFGLQPRMCYFSLLMYTRIIVYGRIKMSMMPLFLITFLLGLELSLICKLLVFRWELIVLLLLRIYFYFCYECDFTKSPSRKNQADIIEALNSTSRYLTIY